MTGRRRKRSLRSLGSLGDRLRRVGCLIAIGGVVVLGQSISPAVAAPLAATRCSTVGLDFSYSAAGATYAVRVERLTARAAKCSTARSLVSQVAEDLLHARRVPARLRGLTVGIIRPCAGCAPQYTGTATHAGERIAFVIAGGS